MISRSLLSLPAPPSRARHVATFILTIILGYAIYIVPNVIISMSRIGGGLEGPMFAVLGAIQFVGITALVWISVRSAGYDLPDIGLTSRNWKRDAIIGLVIGLARLALNFLWIIPATGGIDRPDIEQAVAMAGETYGDLFSALTLGVIGGGFTEELFNRGYFIAMFAVLFPRRHVGIWIAAFLSTLIFVAGHLPGSPELLAEILLPTILYTALFLATGRLTASIVTHAVWNGGALILLRILY